MNSGGIEFPPPRSSGLGWDENGDPLCSGENPGITKEDDVISTHLELNDDTVSLRMLHFQVSHDGVRYDIKPDNLRVNYSVMGLRLQFTLSFQEQPLYVIIKYKRSQLSTAKESIVEAATPIVSTTNIERLSTEKDVNRKSTISSSKSAAEAPPILHLQEKDNNKYYVVHKVEATQSRRPLTQVIKIYNAFFGQEFEVFLVGTKGTSLVVNNISVQAFHVKPHIALSLYDGKTTILFDKLFDYVEFEQKQVLHFLNFLKRFSKMLLNLYDHELAEEFVEYCQQRFFCDECIIQSEQERSNIAEIEEKQDQYISYLKFHHCGKDNCVLRLIREGDYRSILDDPLIRRMIIIRQEELPRVATSLSDDENDDHDENADDSDQSVYFNIHKWKWREAKIQRRKRKAIINFEREQYEQMADCFKVFCPKCKVPEPFLDAWSRRVFKQNEEERMRRCKKKNKPFIPRQFETKCYKCRGPYRPKYKHVPAEWNNRMDFYAQKKDGLLEQLKKECEKPSKAYSYLDESRFSKKIGKLSEVKNLLLKDLTKEGIDAIFQRKQKKQKKKSKDEREHGKQSRKTVTFDDDSCHSVARGDMGESMNSKDADGTTSEGDDGNVVVPGIIYDNQCLALPVNEFSNAFLTDEDILNHMETIKADPAVTETKTIGDTLSEVAVQDEWDMSELLKTAELFQSVATTGNRHRVNSSTPTSSSKSSAFFPGVASTSSSLLLRSSVCSGHEAFPGSELSLKSKLSSEDVRRSKARRPSTLPVVSLYRYSVDPHVGQTEKTINVSEEIKKQDEDIEVSPVLMAYAQFSMNSTPSGSSDSDSHHLYRRPTNILSEQIDRVMNKRLDQMFEDNPLENSDQGKSLMRGAFVWKSGLAGIFPLDHCSQLKNSANNMLLVRITCMFDEKLCRYRIFDPSTLLDIPCPSDNLNVTSTKASSSRRLRGHHSNKTGKHQLDIEIRYFFGICRGGTNKAGQFIIPTFPTESTEEVSDSSELHADGDEALDPTEIYARGFELQHHKRCEYLCSITTTSAHANAHAATIQHGGAIKVSDADRLAAETYGLRFGRANISFSDSIADESSEVKVPEPDAFKLMVSNQNDPVASTSVNKARDNTKHNQPSGKSSKKQKTVVPSSLNPANSRALIWKTASKVSDFNDNFFLPEDAMFSINRINANHIPRNAIWCAHSNQRDIKVYVHELQFPVRIFDELTLDECFGYFSLYSTAVKFALKELDDSCPSMQFSVKETIYALEDHVFSRILAKPWNSRIGSIPETAVALFVLNHEVSTIPLSRVEFLCDTSQNKEFI